MSQQSTAAPLAADVPPPAEPSRSRELIQSITSDYFNISDGNGRPIASLIVLVDRARVPVRAELHLNGNPGEESSRQAVRQAQHVLEERYSGPETLPMQVWQSIARSDPLPVPLPPLEEKQRAASATTSRASARASKLSADAAERAKMIPWQPFAIGVAALALVALLWGLVSWWRGDSTPVAGPASGGVTETVNTDLTGVDLAPVETPIPGSTGGTGGSGSDSTGANTSEGSDLKPSIHANADLTHGMRVRIRKDLRLVLRSEPGANAGEPVGYMQNGQEAEIIGGPVQLQGVSDTIVWWEVRLDDGNIAWAAANTSEVTLLEPAD